MVRRLLVDLLERHWLLYGTLCALQLVMWLAWLLVPFQPAVLLALSLSASYVLSLTALTQSGRTELWLLPIPKREMWEAIWLSAVLLPATATMIAKLPALSLIAPALPRERAGAALELLVLSTLLDLTYAGLIVVIVPVLRLSRKRLSGPVGRVIINLATPIAVILIFGGILWGWLLRSYLPVRLDELGGPFGPLLFAGLAITVAGCL